MAIVTERTVMTRATEKSLIRDCRCDRDDSFIVSHWRRANSALCPAMKGDLVITRGRIRQFWIGDMYACQLQLLCFRWCLIGPVVVTFSNVMDFNLVCALKL